MKALRLLIALAILAISCNNDRGPENDPNIKIENHVAWPNHKVSQVTYSTCFFRATVVANYENHIKVQPVSNTWDEQLWLEGPISVAVPSYGDTVTVFARTSGESGELVWNYFLL